MKIPHTLLQFQLTLKNIIPFFYSIILLPSSIKLFNYYEDIYLTFFIYGTCKTKMNYLLLGCFSLLFNI